MSPLLLQYVLKAALRDRLILSVFVLLALATSLSIFMGSAAVTESDQFAAVFAASSMRLLNIFGVCLFVVFFIRRSFESKDIDFLLTRPLSRVSFLLSYAAGFALIGIIAALFTGLCLYALSPQMFGQGSMLWVLSLALENIIMASTALFFAMVLSSPALAMFSTLGFYVLARMMSQLLGIVDSDKLRGGFFETLEYGLQGISMLMPRLDLMGQTNWLLYGYEGGVGFGFVMMQGAIYTVLILSAALIDLVLRRF